MIIGRQPIPQQERSLIETREDNVDSAVVVQTRRALRRDATPECRIIPDGTTKLEVDNWVQHGVQGVSPCVAQCRNASQAAGCTQAVRLHAPQYMGGRFVPRRSGQIRMHSAPNLDASINKTTLITERVRIQFRAEAFNITNTYYWDENISFAIQRCVGSEPVSGAIAACSEGDFFSAGWRECGAGGDIRPVIK